MEVTLSSAELLGPLTGVGFSSAHDVRTDDGLYRFIHAGSARGDALVLGHQNFAGRDGQTAWDSWMAEGFS
ncbi:hypothetical protein ACRYCC_31330 [Actinomadura scrupuli]|uniref:hypothetical protein n=1 Tax=Actinomadura scrupuli TaxID=559629 RepID=UPI003D97FD3B